jgi:hypothetical protein
VRSQQASPEAAPFESGFLEALVQVVSIHSRDSSAASGTLLVNYELVRSPEEDFARPVLPELAAQWALDGDGLKWEFLDAGWNVAAAPLARDDEGLPA